ncbi:GDSL-type esterase/lipase family protein [Novipirellula caenicola]|uniref:SGNH hydrolase-type esterase domain-containing protein n=1 Tax=Novipirellula caenicola TaxID=1536901 RepID=A0ABP9VX43_9BACT
MRSLSCFATIVTGISLAFASMLPQWASAETATPLLKPHDRLAIVGGTFVERMQSSGQLEGQLQSRRPDWKLTVRNLGWSGDDVHGYARKRFDSPHQGYSRLLADIEVAKPTVVLLAYGFAEASDGDQAIGRFTDGLQRLIHDIKQSNRRVILMTPFPLPGYKTENYQASIAQTRKIVQTVGNKTDSAVVSITWQPNQDETTSDGLVPNDRGYARLANELADALVGGQPQQVEEQLSQQIVRKNELFFHQYRPQNETYLLLFRKHEQGNNAVEIGEFPPLIEAADKKIWAAAAR